MYGDTPADAVQAFLDSIVLALSCVTDEPVNVFGGYYPAVQPHRLVLNNSPVRMGGPSGLHIRVLHLYRVIENASPLGAWQVITAAYYYQLDDTDGREVLSYHWHPRPDTRIMFPHLHLGAGAQIRRAEFTRVHLPTNRVAVQDVLRLALTELGVTPLRSDWETVLANTQASVEGS